MVGNNINGYCVSQIRLCIFVNSMMKFAARYFFFGIVACLFACDPTQEGPQIPVNDFFKSQDRASYRISPDGKCISYLKLQNKKQNLFVEDIGSGKVFQLTELKEKSINFYSWVSNNELIYYKEKGGGGHMESDLFIINKEGKDERQLIANQKSRTRVLEDQLIEENFLLVASNQRDSTVSDVYRLNVRDGKMKMAAQNPGNITNWMTDSKGKLRLAISSDGVNETLLYRETETQPFRAIITNNFKTSLWPVAFAEDKPNTIYAISNVGRDKNALVEINCADGKEKSVLFANDTLNVVDAQYSKQKGKMTYVVYEDWKKEKHYLDEDAKQLYQKLDKLLPKTESKILDRDRSENVFVVKTFTDRNPGSYYLYIANTGSLKKLSDINPAIKQEQMCEMKPISYQSRDGVKINGYLTLPLHATPKNLPVIVLPHNGPGQRNSWGYNAEVQFLANRGYAVLQVNYRGSSGYGTKFFAAGFKQWGGKIQDDIDDGVQWLIDNNVANPQKIAIYGSGFGGYIAITSAIRNPKMYKCVASNSGVLNLFSYLKSIPPFLKSNLQMYYDMVGNPDTDVEYMRQASPVFHPDKINTPIFITHNINDPRFNASDAISLVKKLKKRNVPVTYFERNEVPFSMNREESRQKVYTALEQFLEANLKKK